MKTIFTSAAIWLCCATTFAQTDTTALPLNIDTAKVKATLTLGASYGNTSGYYGQRTAENMPYTSVSATYRLRSGIYFSGMAYKLLKDSASLISASSIAAGISFNVTKNLSADLNYSHTFYPSSSPFLQAANADNISASLTLENWLSTTANLDYAFGKTEDVFFTLGTGKFINLGSLISEKDFVSISPSVDVVGGTQHFYRTYATEKRAKDSLLGLPLTPIFGGSDPDSVQTTTMSTRFDVLSFNLKLPLAYNRANYMFEIAYQASVLGKNVQSDGRKVNSFFTISFYYQF